MNEITYSLTANNTNSGKYYQDVRKFTEKVLERSADFVLLIEQYKEWLVKHDIEHPRKDEEYVLELLSFGILWQTYGHIAISVKFAPFIIMSKMAEWRKTHQKLKPCIDKLRGVLISLFLFPKDIQSQLSYGPPDLNQLNHVYKWFMATGEFREQALRFINWWKFWQQKPADEITIIFSDIESFTIWFKENAAKELGIYTHNVNNFLTDHKKRYLWREDRVQCMRNEAEYHLNMVGAELMNRALRSEFANTDNKAVLLPGCMRKLPITGCKAIRVPGGLKCIGCIDECHVNIIREIGKNDKFSVYVIPHASDLSQWSPQNQQVSLGVVASACLTTLIEGGWELKRYSVPAQCVVLDFCGCKKHWHQEGIETSVNLTELQRILK